MKVFVVYDSKAESYALPFYMKSIGEAVRGFGVAARDQQTMIAKHPADFTLFEIGDYDEFSGNISMYEAKKSLGTALEHINPGV